MTNSCSLLSAELEESEREWIRKAAEVCEQAAAGNLEPRLLMIEGNSDLSRLLHGINKLLDLTDAYVRESGACLDAAAKGKFFRKIIVRGMLGAFRKSAGLANAATNEMAQEHKTLLELEKRRSALADELTHVMTSISQTAVAVRSAAGRSFGGRAGNHRSVVHCVLSRRRNVTQRTYRCVCYRAINCLFRRGGATDKGIGRSGTSGCQRCRAHISNNGRTDTSVRPYRRIHQTDYANCRSDEIAGLECGD